MFSEVFLTCVHELFCRVAVEFMGDQAEDHSGRDIG